MKIPIGAWVALGGVFFSGLALIPRLKQKTKKRIVLIALTVIIGGFFLIAYTEKPEEPTASKTPAVTNPQTITISGSNIINAPIANNPQTITISGSNIINAPIANNMSVTVTTPPPKPYLFPQDIWEANTPTDGGFVTRVGVMVAYEFYNGVQQIKGLSVKSKQNLPRAEMSSNSAGTTTLISGETVPFKEHIFTWVTTNKIDPNEIQIEIIK